MAQDKRVMVLVNTVVCVYMRGSDRERRDRRAQTDRSATGAGEEKERVRSGRDRTPVTVDGTG